jgi:hypothetical protein
MDEDAEDEVVPHRPQMRVDNLVVTTTEELTDLIAKSVNYIDDLGHVLVHMVEQIRNGWTSGYDAIWMKEEDQIASRPVTNYNCFHVDIHEKGHHEINGVLERSEHLMQTWWVALNE